MVQSFNMPSATEYNISFILNDPKLLEHESYVDGKWVSAKSGKRFEIVDPGSDKPWAMAPDNDVEDVEEAIQSSHRAFKEFKKLNPRRRSRLLYDWHEAIVAARDDIATILTHETGKPLPDSQAEIDMALGFAWWFAGEADRLQGATFIPSAPNRRTMTIKQPLGVVVALCPWNYPVAMILRKLAAAFAAGCTVVVKPSPETPLSCLALASLASKVGFPPGVFNVLTTSNDNTPALSEAMITHPLVKKVTFTGSTRVGKAVAQLCAKNIKKCSLELGGNSPYIVFDDASLDQAVNTLLLLKFRHAGQSCISANRVFVQAKIYDEFTQRLVEKIKAELKVGHASDPSSNLGPVTTPRSLTKASILVDDAVAKGAKIVLGTGKGRLGSTESEGSGQGKGVGGYFIDATVITGVTPDMLISREELFTPIAALHKFETEEEVIGYANDTSYGLASYAFTKNVDRMWRLYENLEAGIIGLVSLLPLIYRNDC